MTTEQGRKAASGFYALRVQKIGIEGEDAIVITFDVPAPLQQHFTHEPGQHLTLRVAQQRRSYSICSGPGQPLQVAVRRVKGGQVSTWLHQHAQVGSLLDVMPPTGSFGAALRHAPQRLLLLAGGSGITPMMAMVQAALQRDAQARLTLVYANRTVASTMFKEALDDLKNQYLHRLSLHLVFSRENLGSELHQGRLNAAKINSFLRLAGPVDEAFVCGPHSMNELAQAVLLGAGMQAQHVHVERFGVPGAVNVTGAASALASAAVPGQVATAPAAAQTAGWGGASTVGIVLDGMRRDVPFEPADGSILAAAARAGMDLPFACKSGVCATCRCRLLQGQVDMARNFALQADDLARGFVLSCQARPTTEHVVLSFDDR